MGINSQELYSRYILDGRKTDASLFRMLEGARGESLQYDKECEEAVVDETVDPSPQRLSIDWKDYRKYLDLMHSHPEVKGGVDFPYAENATRFNLTLSLLGAIFQRGSFRLQDLEVSTALRCDRTQVGARAALWGAVSSLCDYLDCIGVTLGSYSLSCSESTPQLLESFKVTLGEAFLNGPDEESLFDPDPFTSGGLPPESDVISPKSSLGRKRKCPARIVSTEKDSWILYIPFDTCQFRLGGSLLGKVAYAQGGTAPDILDADYFMDCFEVVRELVEDGIVISGIPVGRGGLAMALEEYRSGGLHPDISEILSSYGTTDVVSVLFGEVPGVLLQIPDEDYDYVDAELLLQDVAYYPLCSARYDNDSLVIETSHQGGLQGILRSLLDSQASEGED